MYRIRKYYNKESYNIFLYFYTCTSAARCSKPRGATVGIIEMCKVHFRRSKVTALSRPNSAWLTHAHKRISSSRKAHVLKYSLPKTNVLHANATPFPIPGVTFICLFSIRSSSDCAVCLSHKCVLVALHVYRRRVRWEGSKQLIVSSLQGSSEHYLIIQPV